MSTLIIVNGIICVLGVIVGLLFAGASIVSIANMTVPWSGMLIVAALLIPVMFLVSGIGAWLAYDRTSMQVVIGLVALPWIYGLDFVLVMIGSFKA